MVQSLEITFESWILDIINRGVVQINGMLVDPPSWIIEDHINGGCSLPSRDKHGLEVISWWPTTAVSFITHFGNEQHGHGGRLFERVGEVLDISQQNGEEKSDESVFYQEVSSRVMCIPGLPPYYEHEQLLHLFPGFLTILCKFQKRWNRQRDDMKMAIFSGIYEFEPVAATACTNAFKNPLQVFCVGPPLEIPPVRRTESSSDPVVSFLDSAYTDLGPHSVIYLSFGTIFFPLPESINHLKIIIDEVVKSGMRVVFALSSPGAQAAAAEWKETGWGDNVIFRDWVDQLAVLDHTATSYFLSHGGWNSVTESLAQGVPMLFWPLAGEQPTNAIQTASQHGCGYELLQVRTAAAKSVAYAPGGDIKIEGTDEAVREEIARILAWVKGTRGAQQRLNARSLGRVLIESLGKGGSGDLALGDLGKAIGL
ncbi:glycosyltransferase family 1 protein [Ceratobasidium sp. AG-Ba]|nr:glycosyltransferase family 1 protein [Ceratobasidium sp. AG-Ba]QRW10571.1 glycosyltransferase family 1 protein [Ceratobasidium sp. AG-Ba]